MCIDGFATQPEYNCAIGLNVERYCRGLNPNGYINSVLVSNGKTIDTRDGPQLSDGQINLINMWLMGEANKDERNSAVGIFSEIIIVYILRYIYRNRDDISILFPVIEADDTTRDSRGFDILICTVEDGLHIPLLGIDVTYSNSRTMRSIHKRSGINTIYNVPVSVLSIYYLLMNDIEGSEQLESGKKWHFHEFAEGALVTEARCGIGSIDNPLMGLGSNVDHLCRNIVRRLFLSIEAANRELPYLREYWERSKNALKNTSL